MKLLALLSTGIDSPVACYLMLKSGFEIEYLHFATFDSVEKAIEIVKLLKKYGGKSRLFVISHEKVMEKILEIGFDKRYTCVMCKKAMLIVGELTSDELNCEALITGDNLGQVASQTISNLKAEEEQIEIPVLRPLIGFDKVEIVNMAKKIGTYEVSIRKETKCKFVPSKPATKAKKLQKIDVEKLRKLKVEEIVI